MTPSELDNTLRSFMHELYQHSPHTRRQYMGATMSFYQWAVRNNAQGRFPLGMKRADVSAWLSELSTTPTKRGRPPKPATLRHNYAGAHAFFSWMEGEAGDDWNNPFRKTPAPLVGEVEKAVVPPAKMAEVLVTLDRARAWREAAMISLIYDNGIRARSLVNIRCEDVDWDESEIMLTATKGRKQLRVPFSAATWRRMDRWIRHRQDKGSEWLFTGRRGQLTTSGVLQIIKRTFVEVGKIEGVGPHMIRHSFATAYMQDDRAQWQDLKEVGLWSSDTMPQRYAKAAKRQRARDVHQHLSPVERLATLSGRQGSSAG